MHVELPFVGAHILMGTDAPELEMKKLDIAALKRAFDGR